MFIIYISLFVSILFTVVIYCIEEHSNLLKEIFEDIKNWSENICLK